MICVLTECHLSRKFGATSWEILENYSRTHFTQEKRVHAHVLALLACPLELRGVLGTSRSSTAQHFDKAGDHRAPNYWRNTLKADTPYSEPCESCRHSPKTWNPKVQVYVAHSMSLVASTLTTCLQAEGTPGESKCRSADT